MLFGTGYCRLSAYGDLLWVNMKREYIIEGKTSVSGKAGSLSDYWVLDSLRTSPLIMEFQYNVFNFFALSVLISIVYLSAYEHMYGVFTSCV